MFAGGSEGWLIFAFCVFGLVVGGSFVSFCREVSISPVIRAGILLKDLTVTGR